LPKKCYFIDTSALFKRYVKENGSDLVNQIFTEEADRFISMVTLTEVVSNIKRLVEIDNLINEDEFELIKQAFLGELGSGYLYTIEPGAQIIIKSMELCSDKYMTPLDAIQLATALSIANSKPIFLSADQRLNSIAELQGLAIINPAF